MSRRWRSFGGLAILALFAGWGAQAGTPSPVMAANLCVNPGGTGGCLSSIQAAVTAAAAGDTISVAAGTYTEHGITISKALTLKGAGAGSTTVDATGHTAGISVTGVTSGATTISGLTIENAGLQGIFVDRSSNVTIQNNTLTGNDKSLKFDPAHPEATSCPDSPNPFLADDCGEAINLQGTSNSTVANNLVQGNAGGVLLDDETASNHDNTITGNTVQNNILDCGITLASHFSGGTPAAPLPGHGLHDNAVTNNTVSANGAAGVGIFASIPGDVNHDNLVQGNTITNNGLPGVTMHAHAPGQNINGNKIIGNTISGNAAGSTQGPPPGDPDAGDTVSTGILIMSAVVPVKGTVIRDNTITSETAGIWLANVAAPVLSGNKITASIPIAQLAASSIPAPTGPVTLPNGATPPPPVTAVPSVSVSGIGMSASFTVTYTSKNAGQGQVYFGSGPGCTGLVSVATQDKGAGTKNHTVTVTGNDLPGTVGNIGLQPGATYYFEVLTVSSSGAETDNNGGTCYAVTIPAT